MILKTANIQTWLYGDWLGAVRFLIKKSPGKYQLNISHNRLLFQEKTNEGLKTLESVEVIYEQCKA